MGITSSTGPLNAAASIYGVDDLVMFKKPRQKFNFSVFMEIDDAATLSDESYGKSFVFDRVSGVELPDYQYNVTRLNQYNHQRFVTTRQEISPSSITFYDTVDGHFQNLLTSYASYYYSQGLSKLKSPFASNATTGVINTPSGLNAINSLGRFFFNRIIITTTDTRESVFAGPPNTPAAAGDGRGRRIIMSNCMMTNVTHDRLDYSDSAPVTFTAQFQPEHVAFENF
jgi:hypothetical protein